MGAGAGTKELRVRAARMEDAAELARLSGQLGYPSTVEMIRERLEKIERDASSVVIVAENENGIAAWTQLIVENILELGTQVEVVALVVDENLRRNGAGRRLMEHAEKWGRERGCGWVSVRSNVKRAVAHAFYEGVGFEHIKTQKTFRKKIG
jgi:GNAT superfamily N-acetyltransferase